MRRRSQAVDHSLETLAGERWLASLSILDGKPVSVEDPDARHAWPKLGGVSGVTREIHWEILAWGDSTQTRLPTSAGTITGRSMRPILRIRVHCVVDGLEPREVRSALKHSTDLLSPLNGRRVFGRSIAAIMIEAGAIAITYQPRRGSPLDITDAFDPIALRAELDRILSLCQHT
jgi:hypothetical protein